MADPRIIRTSDPSAAAAARHLAAQYEELDRAFGVPEPGMSSQPQRPMTAAEQAAHLLDEAGDHASTTNLGRLEELTTALEVLYRDGVGYPFRDAIGELGHNLSTARVAMVRAGRLYAEELGQLERDLDTARREPRLGCATTLELLTELTTRLELHPTETTARLLAADTCRRLADHLDETTLSYRTIDT